MILSTNSQVHLAIESIYDGVAAISDDGRELAFPSARKRTGEHDAMIDDKNCRLRLDGSKYKSEHPFLYARVIDG